MRNTRSVVDGTSPRILVGVLVSVYALAASNLPLFPFLIATDPGSDRHQTEHASHLAHRSTPSSDARSPGCRCRHCNGSEHGTCECNHCRCGTNGRCALPASPDESPSSDRAPEKKNTASISGCGTPADDTSLGSLIKLPPALPVSPATVPPSSDVHRPSRTTQPGLHVPNTPDKIPIHG